MFTLGVSDHVMVAHRLANPAFGRAQQLHGATYVVELEVRVEELGLHDVVMDIGVMRGILRQVLDGIDYSNLDEHPAFAAVLSTAERVAEYIADQVADRVSTLAPDAAARRGASLRVLVRESPAAYAAYERKL